MSRRFDPDRRDRIIDATIDCIAADGVAGTSHRKVAVLADVPLGSMTYHFENMDELLEEAFARFATLISETFTQRIAATTTQDEALDAIVAIVHDDLQRSAREHVLTYELYTLAARNPRFRIITRNWMHASRAALALRFPPEHVRTVDAFIEGAALHVALDDEPRPRADTRNALIQLLAAT